MECKYSLNKHRSVNYMFHSFLLTLAHFWASFELGLKKILFVSDFRPTLSKHVRPKFILWISQKKKKKIFFFLGNP